MKIFLFIFIVVLHFSFESVFAAEHSAYTFKAHQTKLEGSRERLIDFLYTNTSSEAQCLRFEDMELKLTGDSLYVSVFIVLPPGAETRGNIYLDKYYDSKRREVYVSYKIPVVFCKRLLQGYIEIPPTDVLKDKLNNKNNQVGASSEIENLLRNRYPEWTQHGFIAESETVHVN